MSSQNWNHTQQKPHLSQVQLSTLIRLEITKEFQDKVKYLCTHEKVRKDEWSGLLFYEQEGSIKDPENLILRPKEILLMDIGNTTFTEYKFTAEVSSFIMDNNLMMCRYGHIHSHNNMAVFFSPTDDAELNRNVETHNFYLSLIVNNYMNMIAKVVFAATPSKFICPDEDGEGYEMKVQGLRKLMFIYDCEIIKPDTVEVSDQFKNRLDEILDRTAKAAKKRAEEAAKEAAKKAKAAQQATPKGGSPNTIPPSTPAIGTANLKALPGGKTKEDEWQIPGGSKLFSPYEDFICYLLRRGNEVKSDNVEQALKQANDDFNSGTEDVVEAVVNNYTTYYDNYFCVDEKGLDTNHFLDVLEEIIATCEITEGYTWTDKLAGELRMLGNRAEHAFEQLKNKEK